MFDTYDHPEPCSQCGQPRESAEAAVYGTKCEDCWASLFPLTVGATSGRHVDLRSEDEKGNNHGPRLW